MWRDGELLREEVQTLRLNFDFKNELLLMLECAGFVDVVVHGDHRQVPPTRDSDFVVFAARKP